MDFYGMNCYNIVVDCANRSLLPPNADKLLGGNFQDNTEEIHPRAVYDAACMLRAGLYYTDYTSQRCISKDSASWYRDFIRKAMRPLLKRLPTPWKAHRDLTGKPAAVNCALITGTPKPLTAPNK